MRFTPSNSKMPLQNWIGWKRDLVLGVEEFGEIYRFSYFRSRISPGDRISDKVSSHMQKT